MNAEANQYITLTQGQPFWLDETETIWQVWEGTVSVHAVSDTDRYQQLFLFEAGQGMALFGIAPQSAEKKVRLMLMSTEVVTLRLMTRSQLVHSAAQRGRHLFEAVWFMIEEWLDALFTNSLVIASPRSFLPLETGGVVTLQKGQTVQSAKGFMWARITEGQLSYGPLPTYNLPVAMPVFLTNRAWLTAEITTTLEGLTTENVFPPTTVDDLGEFWQPLEQCHHLFEKLMTDYFTTEIKRDSERLKKRQRQQEKLLAGAAANLLRTDLPQVMPLDRIDDTQGLLLTAVQAIAVHLGIAEDRVHLPKGQSAERVDDAALRNIARLAGMQIRLVALEKGWQHLDNGPLLAYYKSERQPVALLPISPGKYKIFDPKNLFSSEATDTELGGLEKEAYVFYAGLPEQAASIKGWLTFTMGKCWASDFWNIVLTSLAAGIIPMLTPFVTQTIFNDIIPINDHQSHIMVVQVMVVAAFSTAGVSIARGIALLRLKGRSHQVAEAALWVRMLSLPTSFFRKYQAGDLAQRMNSITQIMAALSESSLSTLLNALFSFWSLLVMAYYSWKLTLVAVALVVLYLSIVSYLVYKTVAYKRQMMVATGATAGTVLQLLNGISKFRIQGAESQAFFLWSKHFGEQWKWDRATRWKSNWLDLVNTTQPVLLSMLVFGMTMHWLDAGDKESALFISQPDFMGFNAALSGFNVAIIGIVPVIMSLLDIIPQLERVQPILEAIPEASENKTESGDLAGKIDITNVSFRYAPEAPLVLHHVSLAIRPGQFAAIVGGSGSGKSTLVRLLLGFEHPETGTIYFDGQDYTEISATSVRSQMGVVLQNGQLMAGDIYSNIVGSMPLTLDDAWRAAEMVGLADDIRAMPMGMHTMISEGASNISGGQRQRILIARSIASQPRIIIFDEATSALDNRTQAIVTENLDKLKATRIVVAHRLSTIINADIIYVMDKGRIVETGTFDKLMEQDGLFAALAKRQM